MGEYFEIVCHDCRRFHRGSPAKLREIRLNARTAAEVGWFATLHPGHQLELRGDEYNYSGERDRCKGYEREPLPGDDEDIRFGMAQIQPLERSGRTGRMLAHAAREARDGKHVTVFGKDPRSLLERLIRDHGGVAVAVGRVEFYKAGSGPITFLSLSDPEIDWDCLRRVASRPHAILLIDHFAIETRFSALLAMLHRWDPSNSQENSK